MQFKDLKKFFALNTDDNPNILPEGDVVDALNVRMGSSDEQHGEGNAETLQGEISVLINPDSLIQYYGNSIGGQFVYPGFDEVRIGSQIWMKKNWDVNYPGSKVYNDNEANREIFGGLYTHDQVMTPGFCPDGYHVPTEAEVDILIAVLLGQAVAGGKLKDVGWWDAPNTGADDSSGFKAMPGGGFGIDVMYYGSAIGSDFVYDLLGSTGLLWLADEVPDITSPPAFVSAEVPGFLYGSFSNNSMDITFDAILANILPDAPTDFILTFSGGPVLCGGFGMGILNGGTAYQFMLLLDRNIAVGETGTIQYIPGTIKLRGVDGSLVPAFTGNVTNNVV